MFINFSNIKWLLLLRSRLDSGICCQGLYCPVLVDGGAFRGEYQLRMGWIACSCFSHCVCCHLKSYWLEPTIFPERLPKKINTCLYLDHAQSFWKWFRTSQITAKQQSEAVVHCDINNWGCPSFAPSLHFSVWSVLAPLFEHQFLWNELWDEETSEGKEHSAGWDVSKLVLKRQR